MFERWAIRQKSTGYFLPQSSSKKHGYTHDEPVDCGAKSNWCPRLFGREQDAKTALTWWLKGATTAKMVADPFGEVDEHWDTEPLADRVKEDFEVVKLRFGIVETAILRETA